MACTRMFAFLANRRLTALCAKNASRRHSLGKLQVDRCLSCPRRSPSHRTDYEVELVSVQLRRLVKGRRREFGLLFVAAALRRPAATAFCLTASGCRLRLNVRFGSKADIGAPRI